MSELERLVEAAKAKPRRCNCSPPGLGHGLPQFHHDTCARHEEVLALNSLRDLGPDMARELIDVVVVLEGAKHFADHHSNLAGAASLFAAAGSALARLAKLGETKVGSDG